MTDFEKKVKSLLSDIPKEQLYYDQAEYWMYKDLYENIQSHAMRYELVNTVLALEVVRGLMQGLYKGKAFDADGDVWDRPYFYHCLFVCEMLMNLRPPLVEDEEDILLAGALCYDILNYIDLPGQADDLTNIYHLDPIVAEILHLNDTRHCDSEADFAAMYHILQDHKLAFLVSLAYRSHVVEDLSTISIGEAHEYMYNTWNYYFSMCIYAREKYHELEPTIIIMQEKMHDLIEVAEIFVERYEKRVKELNTQIVAWEDDNYRLRMKLRKAGYDPQGNRIES